MDDWETELYARADEFAKAWVRKRHALTDYWFDVSQGKFWHAPTKQLIAKEDLDALIPLDLWPTRENARGELRPVKPSKVLMEWDTGQMVESSVWWPGEERLVRDVYSSEAGFKRAEGHLCFNSYDPPDYEQFRKSEGSADLWIEHVKNLYPDPEEHEHFFDWAAHMLQRPEEKCNHGIVLAGEQGIGKDSLLLPLRHGVGHWNTAEIGPDDVQSGFNPFVKSVLIVVNEVRPHHEDFRATAFYNAMKPLLAAPPEQLVMNQKYQKPLVVKNVCRVVMTTNDPMALHIPEGDRRLFMMTSLVDSPRLNPEAFDEGYFGRLHQSFRRGGLDAVVTWLMDRRLADWDPAAPPPTTEGKKSVQVATSSFQNSPVDELVETLLEEFPEPQAVIFGSDLAQFARARFFDSADDLISKLKGKSVHYAMERRGYRPSRPENKAKYKHGKFESRVAYVHKSVGKSAKEAAIESALGLRPLEFNYPS